MAAASSLSTVPSPPALPEGDDHDTLNWVLLDVVGYAGDYPNASFAASTTSAGESIQVSFHAAHPPEVSHFYVYSPDLGPGGFDVPPRVISSDSDLILFRVSMCRRMRFPPRYCDYFIYRAHPRNPSLDLLPHHYPISFKDRDVALLSFGDGDDNANYVVAALTRRYPEEEEAGTTPSKEEFNLHLYRSSRAPEGWTSKLMSVRHNVRPVDSTANHDTTKAVMLGWGALGMVGWADLWRGILVCNVLQENPVLVDIPLPPPARGNRGFHGIFCPHIIRDVTVNLLRDSIKYVEIENSPTKVVRPPHDHPPSVPQLQRRGPSRGWKATAWSLPIPIGPCQDWHLDCVFDVADITIDPMHSEMLPRLRQRSADDDPSEPALPAHLVGFPTMSMDDDVLYLQYKAYHTGQMDVVIAVDMRKQTLLGFARLAVGRDYTLTRNCTIEISKYL